MNAVPVARQNRDRPRRAARRESISAKLEIAVCSKSGRRFLDEQGIFHGVGRLHFAFILMLWNILVSYGIMKRENFCQAGL